MGFFKEEDLTKYEKLSGVETVTATAQTRTFCNAELNSNINEAVEKLTDMGIEIVNVNQTPIIANGITYYGTATITWKRSKEDLDKIEEEKKKIVEEKKKIAEKERIDAEVKNRKMELDYKSGCEYQSNKSYDCALIYFNRLPDNYKDVLSRKNNCIIAIDEIKYDKAKLCIESNNYKRAHYFLDSISDKHYNIKSLLKKCENELDEIEYNKAIAYIDSKKYNDAYKILTSLYDSNYKNSKKLIKLCRKNDESINQKVKNDRKDRRDTIALDLLPIAFGILGITIFAFFALVIYLIFFG